MSFLEIITERGTVFMFDKLSFIEDRFNELSKNISDPEVIQDQEKWRKLCKEHSDIEPIVEKYRAYKNANQTLIDSKEMLQETDDKDFREMIEAEIKDAEEQIVKLNEELKILLLPKDPNDDKNVIVEIRGGAGL